MSPGNRDQIPLDRTAQACARLAASQYGLIGRTQALALGMSKSAIHRRVAAGRWEAVLPAVYRLAGAPVSWNQRQMAAVLWAGQGAVASHRASAHVWGFDDFGSSVVEVTAEKDVRHAPLGIVTHTLALARVDVTTRAGIPVTTPARTLVDLGAVADAHRVESALDYCLRHGLVSVEYMRKTLDRLGARGRNGTGTLRTLLKERDPDYVPADGRLTLTLHRIIRRYNLPEPVREYWVTIHGERYRIDLAYPGARVALEADSFRWHDGNRYLFERDRRRRNALTNAGWRVLHFTWLQMRDRPWEVARDISDALSF